MSLTEAPTLTTVTVTDGCVPMCRDIISCGQTYGGCFTSCPGIPTPEPTVPDYVVSACVALGSTTVSTSTESESTDTMTVTDTPTVTETDTQTINTIGTDTGVFTILTETTSFTTEVSNSTVTEAPTNGTTTGLPEPTNTEPSGAERGIGAVKLGMVFGTLIAVIVAGGSVF
ncbi:hypothetical protein TWF281_011196 [Arthrobotrys megalospora]